MFENDFYHLDELETAAQEFSARISLNPEHIIFKGHFPGYPVVPGVVMMQGVSSSGSTGITMTAESHSTFSINLTAVNDTTFTWTGYILDLDPGANATFVPNSAGSTVFDDVAYIGLYRLEFSNGEVLINKPVGLQFDVEIPDTGLHTFTLTQTPIPEPATVALLGLGSLALLLRRRNR